MQIQKMDENLPKQVGNFLTTKICSIELPNGDCFDHIVGLVTGEPHLYYIQIHNMEETFLALYSTEQQSQNRVLWKTPVLKSLSSSHNFYAMVKQDEFIAIDPREGTISLIRPFKKERVEYRYDFASIQTRNNLLFSFESSKLFCIAEMIWFGTVQLSYFSSDTFHSDQSPIYIISQFQSLKLIQLDSYSRIGTRSFDFKSYRSFQLRFQEGKYLEKKRNMMVVKVELHKKIKKLIETEDKKTFQWRMLLQLSSHQYLVGIKQNRGTYGLQSPFIVDTSLGDERASIKKLYLTYNNQKYTLPMGPFIRLLFKQIDCYLIIEIKDISSVSDPKKILFIDKKTMQVQIYRQKPFSSKQLQILRGNTTAMSSSRQPASQSVQITDWLLRQQFVYLHLLFHLNEDFDDDLVQDCVDMLLQCDEK